jgi:hypothetical protein
MTARIALAVAAIALVLAASAGPAAAGQSPQQQATTFVCSASMMIKTDTQIIGANIVAPATPTSINAKGMATPPYGSLQHIAAELAVIRKNLPALPSPLRLQATAATAAFLQTLVPIARGLTALPSGQASPAQLKIFTTAQKAIGTAYTKTLGAVSCPA